MPGLGEEAVEVLHDAVVIIMMKASLPGKAESGGGTRRLLPALRGILHLLLAPLPAVHEE
jgi:hypothetical protein